MNKTILITDDEIHMRDLIGRAIEPILDYNVELHYAFGGQDAIDKGKKLQPNLVILDMMMPDLNGIEVCQVLKNFSHPPYVLMLTAMGQTEDKLNALEVGADEYLTKPFDPDKLLERVIAILRVA